MIKENSIPPCRAGPLARVHKENFISPRWDLAKLSKISPRRAGSLLIWTHYIFIRVSLRTVRSLLGDQGSSPNRASSPPNEQPRRKKLNKKIKHDVIKHAIKYFLTNRWRWSWTMVFDCQFMTILITRDKIGFFPFQWKSVVLQTPFKNYP